MEIIKLILFSLALGIPLMVEMQRNSSASEIKSIRGVGISVTSCVLQTALMLGGLLLGKTMQFEPTEPNGTIALALLVVIAVKMFIFLLSKKEHPNYDLSKTATVFADLSKDRP